jgi:hypothetical protein
MIPNIDSIKLVYILQAFIIQARLMAYLGEPHKNIATVLDDMDHICNLICDKQDQTAIFCKTVQETIQKINVLEGQHTLSNEILDIINHLMQQNTNKIDEVKIIVG